MFLIRLFYRMLPIMLAGIIFYLSITPSPPPPVGAATDIFALIAERVLGDASQADKVSHFVAYTVFAGATVIGYAFGALSFLAICVIITGFSAVMEYLQYLTDYRVADVMDFAANAGGVTLGALAALLLLPILPGPRRKPK